MPYITPIERMAIEKERQTIAMNLLRQNISLEVIVQVTGLTIEQIEALLVTQTNN
jgi:hypothetical protein